MFKFVKMWQLGNPNTNFVFNNAFLLRDKQFKVWWTPFFPRPNVVGRIQGWMVNTLDIAKSYKKYYY